MYRPALKVFQPKKPRRSYEGGEWDILHPVDPHNPLHLTTSKEGLYSTPVLQTFTAMLCECFRSIHLSCRQFAEKYKASGRPLHIMVANAGANFSSKRLTEDGVPLMCQVHPSPLFSFICFPLDVMASFVFNCQQDTHTPFTAAFYAFYMLDRKLLSTSKNSPDCWP